jgi:putative Ca2+/H+ antiporter (TMEM165/GDT1 family)
MWPTLAGIFATIFFAELGDKTQLATLLFATEGNAPPALVFAAAGGALVLSTAIAVLVGTYAAKSLETLPLRLIAGVGFILIGVWTLIDHFRAG